MSLLRRLYARLRLRVNESKSTVARVWQRSFLGFSFWAAPRGEARLCVAKETLGAMKARVRQITARSGGRSLIQVCGELREYLMGWKAYFRLAQTPRIFAELDEWIRHRLRALQLKQWKRGRTIYRELRARGLSQRTAAQVAVNGRRWWHNASMAINIALPNRCFARLGLPEVRA